MRLDLFSLLLFFLIPLTFTAPTPTPTQVQDVTAVEHLHAFPVQGRQAAPSGGAAPSGPAAPPPPAASSAAPGSSSSVVTTIVQAVWPDVDPLIEQAVIYFASGIPSLIQSFLSSWGL